MKWNLGQLYSSAKDPRIEQDIRALEIVVDAFAKKYDTADKLWLTDAALLKACLDEYDAIGEKHTYAFYLYFYYRRDLNSKDTEAASHISLFQQRLAQLSNKLTFLTVSLGKIPAAQQKLILAEKNLARYKVFLSRIFDDAKHVLSVAEEKILTLKHAPGHSMWVEGNERLLNAASVTWKGKKIPVPQAANIMATIKTQRERIKLSQAIYEALKPVAPFAEAELNAIITDHKIDDELRGFKTPYESTVLNYRNDPAVVERLVKTVTDNFGIAQRFYKIKARLLKLDKLVYPDRAADLGTISKKFSFSESVAQLTEIFRNIDPKYANIFGTFLAERRIDALPRVGKTGGAYCSGMYGLPTFVLLNHTDSFDSFITIAHEMGHAFHTELSRSQGALYCDYSYALAETASTFFQSLAHEAIYESLSDKEKIIALHDKINDDVSTIFRQIACFNYEKEMHEQIRTKGFLPEKELALLHNKHMSAYLGPIFKLEEKDGYMFVQWSHLRSFFYVYSYAFGMLVSKALLRKYHQDKTFITSVEKFLSAGGSDSPENILKSIGIDVTKPEFFRDGLREIEDDIVRLEQLTKVSKKP